MTNMSESQSFTVVVGSTSNITLAYEDYLLGHAQWFVGPAGSSLLAQLVRRARR